MSFVVESVQWLKAAMAVVMIFGPAAVLITGLRRERKPETTIGGKKGYALKEPCSDEASWVQAQSIAASGYINGGLAGFFISAVLTVVMVLLPLQKAVLMLPGTVALQCVGLCLLHSIIHRKISKALKNMPEQKPE